MTMKIGINGFGRIGRKIFSAARQQRLEVAMINDPIGIAAIEQAFLQPDPVTGEKLAEKVERINGGLEVDGLSLIISSESSALRIPWSEAQVSVVEECSGRLKSRQALEEHREHPDGNGDPGFRNGVVQIIASYPVEGIPHYAMGVNQDSFDPDKDQVISNASCSTKLGAVILREMIRRQCSIRGYQLFGVHAATNSQSPLEVLNNTQVHSSGASKALLELIPELKKLEPRRNPFKVTPTSAYVTRVPAQNGSFMYINVVFEHDNYITPNQLNKWFQHPKQPARITVLNKEAPDLKDIQAKENRGYSAVVIAPRTTLIHTAALGDIVDCDDDPGPILHTYGLLAGYDNETAPALDQVLLTKYIIDKRCDVNETH